MASDDMKKCFTIIIFSVLSLLFTGCFSVLAPDSKYAQFRIPPLRTIDIRSIAKASDFGAFPDDGASDTEAIQAALDYAAKASVPTKVVFRPGRYLLEIGASEDDQDGHLFLNNATNVVVDFNGALLICKNPLRGFFRINRSENIIVQNATIDYDPITHTEGWIRSINSKDQQIVFEVREGFPSPLAPHFKAAKSRWMGQMDPVIAGRLKRGTRNFHFYSGIEPISENRFQIQLRTESKGYFKTFDTGDRIVLLARHRGPLFFADQCRQVTALELTAYNIPGVQYESRMTDALNVIRCKALIKPGAWKGGNADGVHCKSNRIGPWVEGCVFEGISDDSMVVFARPFSAIEQPSPRQFKICRLLYLNGNEPPFKNEVAAGDTVDFLDPDKGTIFATARVTAYDPESQLLEVDRDIQGLNLGIGKQKTQIWNRSMGRGFVLKDNIIRNSRRYGVYMKGSDGLIENNTFIGLSSCAITLQNEPAAPNGPFCHNVVIRNNTITDCGFEYDYLKNPDSAVLSIFSKMLNNQPAKSGTVHSGITIENNRFNNPEGHAMLISNVKNGSIISNVCKKIGSSDSKMSSAIYIKSSKNVSIGGNEVDASLYSGSPILIQKENVKGLDLK